MHTNIFNLIMGDKFMCDLLLKLIPPHMGLFFSLIVKMVDYYYLINYVNIQCKNNLTMLPEGFYVNPSTIQVL